MSTSKKSVIISNILIFVIGTILTIWGIIILVLNYTGGPNYLSLIGLGIAGVVMLIVGIVNVTTYRFRREKILTALKSYERVSLEQLSSELNLKEKQTKDIIVDLRTEGKLKVSFEPGTGDVLVLEVKGEAPVAIIPMSSSGLPEHEEKYKDKQKPKDLTYCPHCGSIKQPEDLYCISCGSYLG